jgi:tetratricopeptide (TPR) repeat protein
VLLLRREESDLNTFYSKTATIAAISILPLVLLTLFELANLYSSEDYTHLSTYSFRFTFGNRNQYSELLTLLIPIIAIGYFSIALKWKKIFFALTIILLYATISLLQNRAVFLVLYGVYPFIFGWFLLQKANSKNRKIGFWFLITFVLLGAVLLFTPARSKIPFLQNLLETRYGSGNERIRIWKNSIDLWQESPLFGKGSGDWKIEILKTPLEFTQAEGGTVFFQRAHNDFIQVAVENGILGLILFLLFFGISSFLLFKSTLERPKQLLLFGGVLGYILISNFSFPIEKIELLLLLFLFFLPGLSQVKSEARKHALPAFRIAITLLITLGLSLKWLNYEKDYFLYKKDNNQLALSEIDKNIYSIDPTSTPLYWIVGNELFNQKKYEDALVKYKLALKYNPFHVHVINNIGSCYYALGEIDEAEKQFKKALNYNPKFVETLMNYTSLEFNRSNIDEALNKILTIPERNEPENYKMFILVIAKAKYHEMMDKYDEPEFEEQLSETITNDDFLFAISRSARISGECYEVELRKQLAKMTVQ